MYKENIPSQSAAKKIGLLQQFWHSLNGDAAYERYLAHWSQQHAASNEPPLNRKDFFAAETQRKWNGIKRCC